ncbi:Exonuclease [uncultured archaeon]|nr:Exonuclease [uncultured archaeon]
MRIQFLDTELLCWEYNHATPPNQEHHIIQIGIVEVESNSLVILRSQSFYVRPDYKNFDVSDYCTELTGITRSKLMDEGHYFPEVLNTIRKKFAPHDKPTYTWGNDFDCLQEHCSKYRCENPWIASSFIDFGVMYKTIFKVKNIPLQNALKNLHLEYPGSPHNALNDARALADLHNEIMHRASRAFGVNFS